MKIRWLVLVITLVVLQLCSCSNTRTVTSFARENTTYVISTRIDLHGGILEVPKNCTLDFRGGCFVNGRLICNETTFKGHPRVENVSGTVSNSVFYSSWVTCQDKLSILCGIKTNRIVLDENLTLRTHIANDFMSSVLDGSDHVIKVDYNLFEVNALIRCLDNVKSIRNLHFDFGNHEFHSIVLWFPHRTESLDISNVTFSNLNNASVRKYGFEGIGISAKEAPGYSFKRDIVIGVSKVSALNMRALSDNSGKDGESTMAIVYVNCNVPSALKRHLTIDVNKCDFKEIVVCNNEGDIVANDSACIYVHQDETSTNSLVQIHNITGYNFGRRLIKTDGGNLQIENIKGESYNGGSLCMVGCNNGDVPHSAKKASISGLTFRGRISHVVACMVDDTVIKNIHTEFTDYISPRVLSGVLFVGDDAVCQVDGVNVNGKGYLYSSASQTCVIFRNVNLTTDNTIAGIHYLFNTLGIKSVELNGFVFTINGIPPTLTTYQNANPNISNVNSRIILRNGIINVLNENGGTVIKDYSTRQPHSLSIDNVNISFKHGSASAISISSPTLRSLDVNNVHVKFEKADDFAKVMNLECNNTAKYSLSKITCETKLNSSPILLSGSPTSKVSLKDISVNGHVSIKGNVRISNK